MAYQPSEKKAVEEPVVKYAVGLGIKVLKINPLWAAGWNDRIFFIPGGKPLIIEFKRPGGKVSKLQAQRHKELLRDGYDHHVIDNTEEGKALVRSRLEAYRLHEKSGTVDTGTSGVRTVSRSRAAKD
jgi:VRR-NUC domain.